MKYSFKNDYSEGAHPDILEKISLCNTMQWQGYGEDNICQEGKRLIKQNMNKEDADVHFVSGGTQANLLVISSMLKPYEAVIAATTGHIEVHETGAIEATGHKIITTQTSSGKLTPANIQSVLDLHIDEHMVRPKMVYISNATELGTVYTQTELEALSLFCKKNNLYLFMDGARLGAALVSHKNDMSLAKITDLVDALYIGGTKNGALLGEAIVLLHREIKNNFRYHMKQKGALLAKSWLLGIQFECLFKDTLFVDLAKNAYTQAMILSKGIEELGYRLSVPTESNQVFPIFDKESVELLKKEYDFHVWEQQPDGSAVVRLVTSWACTPDKIKMFLADLKNNKAKISSLKK